MGNEKQRSRYPSPQVGEVKFVQLHEKETTDVYLHEEITKPCN